MASDQGPFNLDLVLTRQCTLSCGYCRMDHRGGSMPESVWRSGVDLLLKEEGPLELQFMGGEPLLEFDLLREISAHAASKARKAGRTLRQVVTTNGLLLTPARSKELGRLGCGVMLSMDGGHDSQTSQRTMGSSDWTLLRRHLRALLSSGARSFVNLVVTPESAPRLAENAAFIVKEGVRELQIAYALGTRWDKASLETLERQLQAVADLAGSAEPRVELYNRGGRAEPVLLSPQHLVDSDGTLYVGTAIVLEKLLPALQDAFRVGDVRTMERLPGRRRTRVSQLRLVRKALAQGRQAPGGRTLSTPGGGLTQESGTDILLNNLEVGQRMRKFWRGR